MGIKHSANFQNPNVNQKILPERNNSNQNLTHTNQINNGNNINNNFPIPEPRNNMRYPGQYQTLSRRQSVVYNYNTLPPKPPRQNPENLIMTGGSASSRPVHLATGYKTNSMSDPLTKVNVNNQVTYRKHESISNEGFRNTIHQPEPESELMKFLECPICFNLFDNPHVLPCQHIFCKNCLQSILNNDSRTNTIDCPICREKHTIQNGLESMAANYTMKRLIESMTVAEKEKKNDNAKCFSCQKYSQLKVCNHCSYMLCQECTENPDHDIIIEAKINSKKKYNQIQPINIPIKRSYPLNDYCKRDEVYIDHRDQSSFKLKLILLCHSSAVELAQERKKFQIGNEVLEDEYGKCTTFHKISISAYDRVITLKKIVEKKFGILCKDQILVCEDRFLKSDLKPLMYYNIRQFSNIHIFDDRDIKENSTDIEEDLYGIYQDTSICQTYENSQELREREKIDSVKNTIKNRGTTKSNNGSSSLSSHADSLYDNHKKNKPKLYAEPHDELTFKRLDTKRSSSAAQPARNYYSHYQNKYSTMTKHGYRRLGEIFDQQINLRDY